MPAETVSHGYTGMSASIYRAANSPSKMLLAPLGNSVIYTKERVQKGLSCLKRYE
jgi:hypothetical protein